MHVVTCVCGYLLMMTMSLPEFDYKWHYDNIKRMVISYLKSGQSIDDLIHTCIEKVLRYRDTYDSSKMKYSSWVYMIATQAALDLQTEELDNNKLLTYSGVEVYSQTEICTPENEYASKELAMRIQRVLDSLPENQRKVVIQYDIEQLPMYVIADNLQLKYGYVRNLYMFARNSINKAIEEYFNDG